MKRNDNFEIQRMLDQKVRSGKRDSPELSENEDVEVYEFIYRELAKDPEQGLPMSFRADVIRNFERHKKRKSDWVFYGGLLIVCLVGILSAVLTISFFKDEFSPMFITLGRFKGVIAVALVGVIAFNMVENKSFRSTDRS